MDGPDLTTPLTCTLSPPSRRAERKRFRKSLLPHITGQETLPDGLRIDFDAKAVSRAELDRLIRLDADCCKFLDHRVEEAGDTRSLFVISEGNGTALAQAFCDEFPTKAGMLSGKAALIGLVSFCGLGCGGTIALTASGAGTAALAIGGYVELALLGLVLLAVIVTIRYRRRAHRKDLHADRSCC